MSGGTKEDTTVYKMMVYITKMKYRIYSCNCEGRRAIIL